MSRVIASDFAARNRPDDRGDSLLWTRIQSAAAAQGLIILGGFHAEPSDGVPALSDGEAVGTLIVIGNAGPAMWRAFSASPEAADGAPHPLNRWTERVITTLAAAFGARALFPFGGPPYLPFVAWAKRAAPVRESPLGILIHPEYGLWHAYRGALAFAGRLALPPRDPRVCPCEGCAEKPCLGACPVGAFGPAGYDVDACVEHIGAPAGTDCLNLGCRARRACPVGRARLYEADQAAFHMRAFLAARQGAESRP